MSTLTKQQKLDLTRKFRDRIRRYKSAHQVCDLAIKEVKTLTDARCFLEGFALAIEKPNGLTHGRALARCCKNMHMLSYFSSGSPGLKRVSNQLFRVEEELRAAGLLEPDPPETT